MFLCKQHSENSFPGAYPPVILVLAVTPSQQLSSLNMATRRRLKSCLWQQPWWRWQASAFHRESHLPKRAPPWWIRWRLNCPHAHRRNHTATWGKKERLRQRFATIHHHNLLSHRNDLVNATDSWTNERLLTCCHGLRCEFFRSFKGIKKTIRQWRCLKMKLGTVSFWRRN